MARLLTSLSAALPSRRGAHQTSSQCTCTDAYLRVFLFSFFSFFFFCRRATGGPEVAMGTGPWPQPPTEAEQLQALMAAANGESCTSSSFLLLLVLLHPFIFWPNLLLVPLLLVVVACVGMLSVWVYCWRATSQTGSLTRPAYKSIFFFSSWRLTRGCLPRSGFQAVGMTRRSSGNKQRSWK